MKPLLIACLICTPAFANDWTCTADGGVMFQSQRVIELPADQDKYYVTIFSDSSPQAREVIRWFNTNPQLAKLKDTTHFHVVDTNSTMFRHRYDATTGETPCLRIQKADGTVLYQCSKNNLPMSSHALANSIQSSCLRRRNEPEPQPEQNYHYHFAIPNEQPDATPDTKPQPDVFEPATGFPTWTLVVAGVVAVVGGVAFEWRRSYAE